MNAQSLFKPEPMNPREKAFVGAVCERCWPAAVLSVEQMGGLSLTRAASTGAIAVAFQRLLTEAPDEIVAACKGMISPSTFSRRAVARYRSESLMLLSQAHLDIATAASADLACAHFHVAAAIDVCPRSESHEIILAAGFASFAGAVGRAEVHLFPRFSDFEKLPCATALQTAKELAKLVPAHGYHPLALARLLRRLRWAACSPAALLSSVQLTFESAHWPSWRGLLELSSRGSGWMKPLAIRLLQEELPLTDGAREYLRALRDGSRPQNFYDDDVPF